MSYCCSTKGAKQLLKSNFPLEQKTGVGLRGALNCALWLNTPDGEMGEASLVRSANTISCFGILHSVMSADASRKMLLERRRLWAQRGVRGRTEAESQDVSPSDNCLWLVTTQGAVLRGPQCAVCCWRRWMFRPHQHFTVQEEESAPSLLHSRKEKMTQLRGKTLPKFLHFLFSQT